LPPPPTPVTVPAQLRTCPPFELGQSTPPREKFFTDIVENPVEKIGENRIALRQSEEISRLHYRGAIRDRVNAH
jgi:hypothetical protein